MLARLIDLDVCVNRILWSPGASLTPGEIIHFLMVLVLDGNSEHVGRSCKKIGFFGEQKIRFVTALDKIKSLQQIK